MVKAELIYNPYLLSTKVLFNGREPRINSIVEKYQNGPLQNWVRKIPSIFYDEMNGYDFDLEFTGTKLDFQELTNAFTSAGVSNDMVHLFHKNEIAEREVKLSRISEFLSWLNENRNRKFDYDAFWAENGEFFKGKYSFMVIQKHPVDASELNGPDVEVEYISEYQEIASTDLHNTPVLIFISEENRREFQTVLKQLSERRDVQCEQLFFMTHSKVDADKAKRIVIDLGIDSPQFITSFSDPLIQKYLDLYPRSEFIIQAIQVFHHYADQISSVLEKENKESEIANKSIHSRIDELEDILLRLKKSQSNFVNRDNLEIPESWNKALQTFLTSLRMWRINKTKVVGTENGLSAAKDYSHAINAAYMKYQKALTDLLNKARDDIKTRYSGWYREADVTPEFADTLAAEEADKPEIPALPDDLAKNLMSIKDEHYVQPKEDLFGMLFKQSSQGPKELVLEISFYYQEWRDFAEKILKPLAEDLQQKYFSSIQEFEKQLASEYIEQLEKLIVRTTEEKDQVTANLSDDEKKLQDDNDWLTVFNERLTDIEKG